MFQLPYIRFITTKDKWGSKMKKQVTDLYHHLCPRYGTPTGFGYSSRTSDNTKSGIISLSTSTTLSSTPSHSITVNFFWRSAGCTQELRISSILQNFLYIFFSNPRVSSMGWLPHPKPTLTGGGDTWNTKTKLTLSTLASPGVWKRKCRSPIQRQCQRLWSGNIV